MKQAIAILLILVYIFAGNTLQQLQKAPVLVEHFLEHRKLDPQVSIARYLVLHYLSASPKDADYERDMQLPFKTTDHVSAATTQLYIPAFFPKLTFTPPIVAQVHAMAFDEGFRTSHYLSNIWQPPKFC